jgi:hypothetical protein
MKNNTYILLSILSFLMVVISYFLIEDFNNEYNVFTTSILLAFSLVSFLKYIEK